MNEYLLEIRTSGGGRRPSGAKARARAETETDTDGERGRGRRRRHRRGRYVKFHVKQRPFGGSFVTAVGKLACALGAVGFLWMVLLRVDVLGGVVQMLAPPLGDARVTLDDHMRALALVLTHKGGDLARDALTLTYLALAVAVVNELYWNLDHRVEESLLIVPGLGVQLESVIYKRTLSGLLWTVWRYVAVVGGASKPDQGRALVLSRQFFPMEEVKDIVINEGFVGSSVLYYMVVAVARASAGTPSGAAAGAAASQKGLQLCVVFPMLRPRREVLETVYRTSRDYLEV